MDQLWWVGSLWALVGVAGTVIATWVGANLRDEFSRFRKHASGAGDLVAGESRRPSTRTTR